MTDTSIAESTRVLDVRDLDGEPFGPIMDALEDLAPGDRLVLVNSFEPAPLYGVLEQRGFTHATEHVDEDEWRIVVEHADPENA